MTAGKRDGAVVLTHAESEFISEMSHEPDREGWSNFDPDFRQRDIARLIRRGWFEKKVEKGYRSYRWTEAGRSALKEHGGQDA